MNAPDFPVTAAMRMPREWTDYNGHMNEAFYLVAAAGATDRFLTMIGAGPTYVAGGRSFFTVETHIRYLAEVLEGAQLTITTQVLGGGKKLHLFHRLLRADWMLAATVETLLIHTDLTTRRTSQPDAAIIATLAPMVRAHAAQPADGAGRHVGERPAPRT